jgi:hypothetical protein
MFTIEPIEPLGKPSLNWFQDDKAAKVAALSQALNYIDKFRRNQVSRLLHTYIHIRVVDLLIYIKCNSSKSNTNRPPYTYLGRYG